MRADTTWARSTARASTPGEMELPTRVTMSRAFALPGFSSMRRMASSKKDNG